MKKLFASLAALFFAATVTTASAQAIFNGSNEHYRFGLQLGLNSSSFGHDQYGWQVGWNIGGTALYNTENFVPDSYLRASLLYTRKGASAATDAFKYENYNVVVKDATYHLHYLEIPVRFGYAYEFNDDICFLAETGPYFSFRRGGSIRSEKVDGYKDSRINGRMHEYYEDLRRFDVGWGIHAGAIYKEKYQLTVGYDWGLCEVVKSNDYYTGAGLNLNFSINLAVYFD